MLSVAFFALYEVHDIWSVIVGFAMCVVCTSSGFAPDLRGVKEFVV